MTGIENRVRAIVADALQAPPAYIRVETSLFEGVYRIASALEGSYGIRFPIGALELWTDVADVVIATERAIEEALALVAEHQAQRGSAA